MPRFVLALTVRYLAQKKQMKKLIDAAQEKRLSDLMALIDEHQPNLIDLS